MSEETKDYTEDEKLADETLIKCYEYWQMYVKLCKEQDITIPAIVWVQNKNNHHMMVFTRGEHADDLKEFIDNLR